MKKNRKKFNVQLKNIQNKYSLFDFKKSVIFPGGFFILAILLNEVARIYEKASVSIFLWIFAIVAIGIGIYRLCQALMLVQEISIASEEFQIKKFAQAFKIALVSHEKEKEEELSIEFRDITFPYSCNLNNELEINFRVKLKKGKIARKVEVWFYIPDSFGLISPSEDKSWRQGNDFVVPNIRTVKINLGDISIGPYTPGALKVRVPNVAGEYFLMYSLRADRYSSSRDQVKIVVSSHLI